MSSWVEAWIARGWRRKGGAIENLELWKEAVAAVSPHEHQFRWVAGHAGHPQNEYANHLATRAAAEQSNSAGLRQSEFDAWVEKQQGGRIKLKDTAPFPELRSFQPIKRAWTI
jgi:ribonuclease HI